MATVIPIRGVAPQLPAFLAPNATLIGDVRFGPDCSIWFGAVLRADINYISLGQGSNVQDNSVLHVSLKRPCIIGNHTSLGHNVTAHACVIGDFCLLGMNCVVLDGAVVGDGCLIAAGAVVGEGAEIPPGMLVAGVPAKPLKPVSSELRERMDTITRNYLSYQELYPDLMARALA